MTRDEFEQEIARMEQEFAVQPPELEVTVRDPQLGVEGYVVVWNTRVSIGGPLERCGKGGTRITPGVSLDEIKMLAKTMALKNSAAGLLFGGSKSGLRADPDEPGFEKKYRRFVQLCKPFLFENGGVFGGFGFDIGARPIHPRWAIEELGSGRSFTGKPIELGGTDYDKEGIAGLGVAVAARTAIKRAGEDITKQTASVQGLGAMGGAVVKYFSSYGAKIVAVSDPRIGGSFEIDGGLSAEEIAAAGSGDLEALKSMLAGRGLKAGALDAVLYADVDVLFPSALQDVIGSNNRSRIQARRIVEGANNPMNDESRQEFFGRGIQVIPDFIANPGGVIAAFVEMTSPLTPEENLKTRGKVHAAKKLTEEKIEQNVGKMIELAESLGIAPYRTGRYLALKNLVS
jgi:glutamate dehydrogenase (NAD(P)+)